MSTIFEPGATVRHPHHGAGVVEFQRGDLVTVDFGGRLERVEATSLTAVASLSTAVASARLDDPSDALLRAQALAIRSVNDQWGGFSRCSDPAASVVGLPTGHPIVAFPLAGRRRCRSRQDDRSGTDPDAAYGQ